MSLIKLADMKDEEESRRVFQPTPLPEALYNLRLIFSE
jgi:hypothetical protein